MALDDFRPGASDIDFVAVTGAVPSHTEVAALERAHRRLSAGYRRPYFDGTYVMWRDLAHDPALADLGAHTHEGRFHRRFGAGDPVTWHTLAHHGVAVRGPRPLDITVWTDRDALARWTHRNLDDYRRVWLHRGSHLWSKPGLACLTSWGPA